MGKTTPFQSIIIVESLNDKAFIDLLLKAEGSNAESVAFLDLARTQESQHWGKNEKALKDRLTIIKGQLFQPIYGQVTRIGIIIDADSDSFEKNQQIIQEAIKNGLGVTVFITKEGEETPPIEVTNDSGEAATIRLSFFLMKDTTGTGYLETVLRAIATGTCAACECLQEINACVEGKIQRTLGNFDKQWISYYLRHKVSNKDRKKGDELPTSALLEKYGKELFNLDDELLDGLRKYLAQFA